MPRSSGYSNHHLDSASADLDLFWPWQENLCKHENFIIRNESHIPLLSSRVVLLLTISFVARTRPTTTGEYFSFCGRKLFQEFWRKKFLIFSWKFYQISSNWFLKFYYFCMWNPHKKFRRNIHQCQLKTQGKLQHFHTKLKDHDWSWCCEDAGVSLFRLIVPIIKI